MYTETELVRIAKRENNSKRNYLVVNRLQGKHIPVSPKQAFAMFEALAGKVKEAYRAESLLLIGFAETATAIGAHLAVLLDSFYIQTTREQIPGVEYLFFTEAHSHATEQKLVRDDIEALIDRVDRIVFVEDEVTTGNTIFQIIEILKREYPGKAQCSIASLLNGMDQAALAVCAEQGIGLQYLVKTNHQGYGSIAESFHGTGLYIPKQETVTGMIESYQLGGYVNARRYTTGSGYRRACETLWNQVKIHVFLEKQEQILVIGTEEFMYPAMFVGAQLEHMGNTVRCHATTRSPIMVSEEDGYPLHRRYELASFYEEGRRTFIYDLKIYDRVLILTDAASIQTAGVNSLFHALQSCGNNRIWLFRWG